MSKLPQLSSHSAIHCPTAEQYMYIRTLMQEAKHPKLPLPKDWTLNRENTCITADGEVSFLDYCSKRKYQIIEASTLMPITEWEHDTQAEWTDDKSTNQMALLLSSIEILYIAIKESVLAFFSKQKHKSL